MQINKRKQLVIGATALGALVASATTAHAEVNRRVEKIPFKTETREDPTLPKVSVRLSSKVWKVKKKL